MGGDRVGVVAVEGFGRVVLGGAADVTTLGVEDHRDAGVRGVDMRDEPFERVLGAASGEMRDLRLEGAGVLRRGVDDVAARSEEHTSELQSLMRISYAVFCLKKKKTHKKQQQTTSQRHKEKN